MKQEQRTTPPADDAYSPGFKPPSCDETAQKTQVAASEKPAHEANEGPKTVESGKQAGLDGVACFTARPIIIRTRETAVEELRRRYHDPHSHSFPTYGNPKNGVPVLDPMSTTNPLRSLLGGNFKHGSTIGSNGTEVQHKKRAQPSATPVELTRTKRMKTADNNGDAATALYTKQHFSLAPTPVGESTSVVDLTEPPKSDSVEVSSNRSTRSNHDSVAAVRVNALRGVEKAHSAAKGTKRPRRRKLAINKQGTNSSDHGSDGEDHLAIYEPGSKRQAMGRNKAGSKISFRALSGTMRGPVESISDDELAASENGSSRNLRAPVDDISDNDGRTSPNMSSSHRERGDIDRVNFTNHKKRLQRPVFRLKRAVAGNKKLQVDDLATRDQPGLRTDGTNPMHLIAVNHEGKRLPDYEWLEVKLNFCNKIQYATTKAPLAIVNRPKRPLILALEFAEAGDAHRFGLWAEQRIDDVKHLTTSAMADDSDHLQKIFDKQWSLTTQSSRPDDIKLLEHQETNKVNAAGPSTRSAVKPTSPQQSKPYRSSHLLRSGMKSDGLAPSSHTTQLLSSFFYFDDEAEGQPETRRKRDHLPRQTKDAAALRISDSSARASKPRSPSPSWIEQNPDWKNIWDERPLIFPSAGKNRASVYADDISRLEEGQFLNDNLIGFYSRYLQLKLEQENKELANRICFMNTYFYPKLTEKSGRGINYDGVRTWTAKFDLFSFDYIIIPVNEQAHWYLAIICHPSKLLKARDTAKETCLTEPVAENRESAMEPQESAQKPQEEGSVSPVSDQVQHMSLEDTKMMEDEQQTQPSDSKTPSTKSRLQQKNSGALSRKLDPDEARVITLDSLGVGHSPTCGNLKEYLVRELKDKKNIDIEPPGQFGMTAKGIPEQLDHASCGAFLLGYLREFLKDPDGVVRLLVRKEKVKWDITSIAMRGELRNIIIEERKEQNKRLAEEKKNKRKSNIQARAATSMTPEKESIKDPARPATPRSVGVATKESSSTFKESPLVLSVDRSSSPAKKIPVSEVKSASIDEVERLKTSQDTVDSTSKANGMPQAVKIISSQEPKTPTSSQPHHRASSPLQLRTSPRHNKGKTRGSAEQTPQLLGSLASSPATLGSKRQALASPKNSLSESENLLYQLSSPPSRPASISKKKPTSASDERSLSPSQQLLGEMPCAPSKSARPSDSGSKCVQGQKQGANQDRGQTKKPLLRTMAMRDDMRSPYFQTKDSSQVQSSLESATRRRQASLEEIPSLSQPRPSIENDETHHAEAEADHRQARLFETVDLTIN